MRVWANAAGGVGIGGDAPGSQDFVFMAFFNGDIEAAFEIPINGGEGNGNVEGDFMAGGEHGFGVGANFIGDFAGAAQYAIAADDDEVDLAALHEMAGGVVGEDMVRNFLLGQFPGGKGGALGTRAGFIAEDVKVFALGLGGVQGGGGGPEIDKGEPAGVAVGQDVGAGAN